MAGENGASPGGAAIGEEFVRERRDEPHSGWRKLLFRASGKVVNPGPSSLDLSRRVRLQRILLDDLDSIRSWPDVSHYTSVAGRLQVLATRWTSRGSATTSCRAAAPSSRSRTTRTWRRAGGWSWTV